MSAFRIISLMLLVCLLSSCATQEASNDNPDPFEKYNRNAFRVNTKLDNWALKPAANAYNTITPRGFRVGVSNVFSNLDNVPSMANDLLQAHVGWFLNDFWRFVINSTVGVVGIFDVAKHIGLKPHKATFGMTLHRWGAKPSPYYIRPLLGPSTLNETIGVIPEHFVTFSYLINEPDWVDYASTVVNAFNTRAMLLESQNLQQGLTLDPYLFLRSVYLQNYQYRTAKNDAGPNGEVKTQQSSMLPPPPPSPLDSRP